MDRIVVHAQDQNARGRIRGLQPCYHLEAAEVGQIEIEDDQGGPIFSENAERVPAGGRFPDLGLWLPRQQPAQSGADDRMIIDDQNLHGWTARAIVETEHGSTAKTAQPSPDPFGKVRRPPTALTRSPTPSRP